jgi:hypothetical protein
LIEKRRAKGDQIAKSEDDRKYIGKDPYSRKESGEYIPQILE